MVDQSGLAGFYRQAAGAVADGNRFHGLSPEVFFETAAHGIGQHMATDVRVADVDDTQRTDGVRQLPEEVRQRAGRIVETVLLHIAEGGRTGRLHRYQLQQTLYLARREDRSGMPVGRRLPGQGILGNSSQASSPHQQEEPCPEVTAMLHTLFAFQNFPAH